MWLRYGVDVHNKLVPIEDVPSGKTNLSKCAAHPTIDLRYINR